MQELGRQKKQLKNEEDHNLKSSLANIEYAKTLHEEKEEFNNLREQLDQSPFSLIFPRTNEV